MKPLGITFDLPKPDSLHDFLDMLFGVYTSQLPVSAVLTLIFSAVTIHSFVRTGSQIIGLGFIFLTGAAAIPMLAPIAVATATFSVLFAAAGIITLAWYVYAD